MPRWPAAVVVSLALLLSGCGGGDAAPDGDESSAADDGLTAPGTSLALRDVATVPLDDEADVLDLSVVSVEEGNPRDLKGLSGTPVYVRLKAESVDGDADQFFVETYISAYSGDTRLLPVPSPLTIGPCQRTYFPALAEPGTSLDTCLTFVVDDDGASVDRVAFGNEGDYAFDGDGTVGWSV